MAASELTINSEAPGPHPAAGNSGLGWVLPPLGNSWIMVIV